MDSCHQCCIVGAWERGWGLGLMGGACNIRGHGRGIDECRAVSGFEGRTDTHVEIGMSGHIQQGNDKITGKTMNRKILSGEIHLLLDSMVTAKTIE